MCVTAHKNTIAGLRYVGVYMHKPSVVSETEFSAPCVLEQPV
jgi:hypothetical protein